MSFEGPRGANASGLRLFVGLARASGNARGLSGAVGPPRIKDEQAKFSGYLSGWPVEAPGNWSEWQDLNLRPPRPERGALPG